MVISEKTKIFSKEIEVSPALREYLDKKLSKLEKFADLISKIQVEFKIEGNGRSKQQGLSMTVYSDKNKVFRKECYSDNMYNAIDEIADIMVRQIRKHKEKMLFLNPSEIFLAEKKKEAPKYIIKKRKTFDSKPMYEEEAYLQMKMLHHKFFMFYDVCDERIKIIRETTQTNKGYEEINYHENETLTEQDAIAIIEEMDYDFLAYKDSEMNKVRLLYKRKDKQYGSIELFE